MISSQQAFDFVRSEFERIFIPDEVLKPLCARNSGQFLPDGKAAAPIVCDKIIAALSEKKPLSVVRVGDSEGCAIALTKFALNAQQVMGFYNSLQKQNGAAVPLPAAVEFCMELREALTSADVIGFRAFRNDESIIINGAIARGELHAALGILYAREFLQQGTERRDWRSATITSAWIYLNIIPLIVRLAEAANATIVITGRPELRAEFARRLGGRLEEFIAVPAQWSAPQRPELSHFARAFPAVRKRLACDLRGKLVLIGAGLFGKIYCHTVKLNGGVAVDLGSAFDILAGLKTRSVHKLVDMNALRWL